MNEIETENFIVYFSDESEASEPSKFNTHLEVALPILIKFLEGKNLEVHTKEVESYELSVTLCTDERMKEINNEYRQKDKTTDVLSFPIHESLRPDEIDEFFFDKVLNLGDIIISRNVALKQAEEFNITYEQELIHLMVHGFLHLCGFDHEISEDEEKIMFDLEKELVKEIYEAIGF